MGSWWTLALRECWAGMSRDRRCPPRARNQVDSESGPTARVREHRLLRLPRGSRMVVVTSRNDHAGRCAMTTRSLQPMTRRKVIGPDQDYTMRMTERNRASESGGRSRSTSGWRGLAGWSVVKDQLSHRIATTTVAHTNSNDTLGGISLAADACEPSGSSSHGVGVTGSDSWLSSAACNPGSMQGVRHAPCADFMHANSIRVVPDSSVQRTNGTANVCPRPKAKRQRIAIRRWVKDPCISRRARSIRVSGSKVRKADIGRSGRSPERVKPARLSGW